MDKALLIRTTLERFRSGEYGWTTGLLARTADDRHADVHAPLAARFCAVGGLCKTAGEEVPNGPALERAFPGIGALLDRAAADVVPDIASIFDDTDNSEPGGRFFQLNDVEATDFSLVEMAMVRAYALASPPDPED